MPSSRRVLTRSRVSASKRGALPDTSDVTAIVQTMHRITRAIELYSQDVVRSFGLTGPQLWALKNLLRDGPLTPGQLARSLAVDQSSVSGLLKRLEQKGLVTRARAAEDGRSVRIHLSPAGRSLAQRAPEAAQGRLLHALKDMPGTRVRTLRKSVEILVASMELGDVEARFFFSDD